MEILVAYDVNTEDAEGRRRLRRVAKVCIGFGQRVQKSVFECSLDDMQFHKMRCDLLRVIEQKADSLRIYRLLEPREAHTIAYGRDTYVDFQAPLVL